MKLIPVDSSMLSAIGYDPESRELHVEFIDGGRWLYQDVPEEVYNELDAADSKGRYMRENIIDCYPDFKLRRRR